MLTLLSRGAFLFRHSVLAASLLLFLGGTATASTGSVSLFGAPRQAPVTVAVTLAPQQTRAGETVTATVHATIAAGWHIYGSKLPHEGPLPTAITSLGTWKAEGPTQESKPLKKLDPNFGFQVTLHEGNAVFSRRFLAPAKAKPGALTLPLAFFYQSCNSRICLPPTTLITKVSLNVQSGPARAQFLGAFVAGGGAVTPGGTNGSSGLGLFLLAALGGGLLAILTPCVFPLIPVTLTSFFKQSKGQRGAFARLSLSYGLGIIVLYVLVGAATGALLGAGGVSRVATNPWINLAEFAIFVGFALSFLEVVQIRLPGNVGKLHILAQRHGGTLGIILLGAAFVLASFTCVAPFVGTLLVAAAGGDHWRPLLGMLVFATAFASPFFLFAAFPHWLDRMPRSGLWLVRFKATLGFLELAAALKFLSNADQIWQWKVLTPPVILALWALIFAALAAYLTGNLQLGGTRGEETGRLTPARGAWALGFCAVAVYCIWGVGGRPISPYIASLLPPDGYGFPARQSDGQLPWLTNYKTALATARAQNKPLLIDFTGYTCTNCRFNEKTVFPRPEVQAALAGFVRVQLYTDGGANASENQKLQESKFGDLALPLYGVIEPGSGNVTARTAGTQSPGGFAAFLRQAAHL